MTFLSTAVRQLEGERYFGLDLAKRETQLAVLDSSGGQVGQKRFASTRNEFISLAAELREGDTVALEVTTNAIAIARLIRDNSPARVIMSNPVKTRVIAEARIKTDKVDARVLAELARVNYLPKVWLPDEDTEGLRRFTSDRTSLVRRRTECKNTIHSVLNRNLVHHEFSDLFGVGGRQWLEQVISGEAPLSIPVPELDRMRIGSLLNEIDRIDALVADLESVIASYVAVRPHLKEQMDRLLSITGVDLVVASGLLGAIGDVTRFAKKRSLAHYLGVTTSVKQTGDGRPRYGRITKQGPAEARWLLIEAAEHLRKSAGPMRALYRRIQRRQNHNVAVVAVARKLAELVHHLLINKEDYLYKIPRLTQEKRARWRYLARQKTGVKLASAARNIAGRSALYGTGIGVQGRKLKDQIAKQAAANAERLYEAIVEQRRTKLENPGTPLIATSDLVFDPTQPTNTDWERILSQATADIIRKQKRRNQTDN
jgi:transposase